MKTLESISLDPHAYSKNSSSFVPPNVPPKAPKPKTEKDKVVRKSFAVHDIDEITTLNLFMKQIKRMPTLTVDEEKQIVDEMAKCRQQKKKINQQIQVEKEILQQKVLNSRQIEKLLATQIDRLVRGHLRLVIHIAKRYKNMGLSFMDIINEGTIGLIKAAHRFNPERACRFSTYATWWIRQCITKALMNHSRLIRIPDYLHHQIRLWRKQLETNDLPNQNPADPKIDKTPKNPFPKFYNFINIGSIDHLTSNNKSIDLQVDPLCANLTSYCPYETVKYSTMVTLIQKALSYLNFRERWIINLRFGLTEYGFLTLEETGKILGITRERVRQLQQHALNKLKNLKEGKSLKDFLMGEE